MKHIFITLVIFVATVSTLFAVPLPTAYWTGKAERFTTVTGKAAIRCEYAYGGRSFWMSFLANSCPSSVEVQ